MVTLNKNYEKYKLLRDDVLDIESAITVLITEHGFKITNLPIQLLCEGLFEKRNIMRKIVDEVIR